MAAQVQRALIPPRLFLTVFTGVTVCELAVFMLAVQRNSFALYFLGAMLLAPLSVCVVVFLGHLGRLWGRRDVARILGKAMESDSVTAIRCWAIAYAHVDRSVLLAIEPAIFKTLLNSLASAPDNKQLCAPLVQELRLNWRDQERIDLCCAMLGYLSRFGNRQEFSLLKQYTSNFRCQISIASECARVQPELDVLVRHWQTRLGMESATR